MILVRVLFWLGRVGTLNISNRSARFSLNYVHGILLKTPLRCFSLIYLLDSSLFCLYLFYSAACLTADAPPAPLRALRRTSRRRHGNTVDAHSHNTTSHTMYTQQWRLDILATPIGRHTALLRCCLFMGSGVCSANLCDAPVQCARKPLHFVFISCIIRNT